MVFFFLLYRLVNLDSHKLLVLNLMEGGGVHTKEDYNLFKMQLIVLIN